jgi:hypothetical protein
LVSGRQALLFLKKKKQKDFFYLGLGRSQICAHGLIAGGARLFVPDELVLPTLRRCVADP